jgi:hypothetical protein
MRFMRITTMFQEFLRSDNMSNMMHVRISEFRDDTKSPVPNDRAYMPNGLRRSRQS